MLRRRWDRSGWQRIVGDCLVVLVFFAPRATTALVSVFVLGLEPNGRGEIGDCLVVLPLFAPCVTTALVGISVVGLEPDGLGEIGDCLVVVLLRIPVIATPVVDVDADGPNRPTKAKRCEPNGADHQTDSYGDAQSRPGAILAVSIGFLPVEPMPPSALVGRVLHRAVLQRSVSSSTPMACRRRSLSLCSSGAARITDTSQLTIRCSDRKHEDPASHSSSPAGRGTGLAASPTRQLWPPQPETGERILRDMASQCDHPTASGDRSPS
jgi:hypothetical protein